MPKVLTKLRVDEISAVDKAAGEGSRVVLYKRHDDRERDRRSLYHRLFSGDGRRQRINRLRRHVTEGRDGNEPEINGDNSGTSAPSHVRHLADLVAETSQGAATGDEALAWMLTNRHGRALLTHTNKRNSEATMDLIEVCKRVNVGDVTPPSEHELTAEIQKFASKRRREGESAAAAFARIYNAQDDDGLALRKAVQVCKRANGFPV